MKQGSCWTDHANQVVWGWVERYHVGIVGWGKYMRVRVEDRNESCEFVPERTCHKDVQRTADGAPLMNGIFVCSECRFPWDSKNLYCGHCGAKVVEA